MLTSAKAIDLLAVACITVGCGRLNFDTSSDSDSFSPDACTFGPWSARSHVDELSTPFEEYEATLSYDGLTVILGSNRPGLGGLDLWMSTRPSRDATFNPPILLDAISSTAEDAGPSLSDDGLTLYFESLRNGPAELFMSQRSTTSDVFATAQPLIGPFSGFSELRSAEISHDDLTLYFSATGGGGLGKFDLWSVQRPTPTSAWGQLSHLSINSVADEISAAIDRDERALYLVSDRLELPNDQFVATRTDVTFDFASPLLSPLAAPGGVGEYGVDISGDGTTMIMSIHDPGPTLSDIWIATRTCL